MNRGNMTISVHMWTSMLVYTGGEKITAHEENIIQKILRTFDIGREPGKSPAGYLVWTFYGIREDRRLMMLKQLKQSFEGLGKNYSFHWDGAETRIYEARAIDEHIQQ